MKGNELMIGDWVRMKENHDVAFQMEDVSGSDMFRRWTSDGEYMIPFSYGEIEPIPITPEILEKNFREYLPGINLMYQLKGPYFAMNEEGNQWVFGLVKEDGEKSCRYPLVKITYVHELQHALRLCGIDKEIVL